jgi:hypothetical protein
MSVSSSLHNHFQQSKHLHRSHHIISRATKLSSIHIAFHPAGLSDTTFPLHHPQPFLLRANIVVDQEVIERINAPSTRANLSYISSLVTTPVIKTYSTRTSSSATKSRSNARGSEKNRGADAASRSYDGSALEEIAAVGLDGKANGVSDFLLVAADEGVGRGGGQGGEGGDGDGGETHVDGS